MSAFDYLVFYKYIPILYTSTNPIVEQISNRIAYTCEHSNFRPVLSSKINSSSSFDDGALLDELFFVGVGLGAALLGDGDGPVVSLAGLGDALLGDGDDATVVTASQQAATVVPVTAAPLLTVFVVSPEQSTSPQLPIAVVHPSYGMVAEVVHAGTVHPAYGVST